MMWRLRQLATRLHASGVSFAVALTLFVIFYFTGSSVLLALDALALIPLALIVLYRVCRFITKHSLWSLRNRLLFVYAMFGFVPVLLLFILFAVTTWSFMSELAVYLANSALGRRLDSLQEALNYVQRVPIDARKNAIPGIQQAFSFPFPGIIFYLSDSTGTHHWPPEAPDLPVPTTWKNVHGLLVNDHRFYGWAHFVDAAQQITIVTPLSDEMIANLVPNLGVIALVEPEPGGTPITVGSFNLEKSSRFFNPFGGTIPSPVSRFDVPIELPSPQVHFHLEPQTGAHTMILWVHSRPSAVLRAFFSDSDLLRGVIADLVIGLAVLFLFVEIAALSVGAALSRRITGAVNQLYRGTQQVISGDFSHRIAVTSHDQLGELTESFNQMTNHLERLLVSEKEKERLEAELEIAREVQTELYPRGAAPVSNLHLTARCDPARMVSGDYYDYSLLGRDQLCFAMGDVAGKGISAALLMATIQAALRAQLNHRQPLVTNECSPVPEMDSAALVSSLNKQVWAHTSPEKYATFFFGLYDDRTSTLTYTNAGHLSPLLFRKQAVVALDTNGLVIGAFNFAEYDASCIQIEDGDLLVCYTDGITEPENAYGEMFGEERLIDLVQRHLRSSDAEIIRIIFEAVRAWTGIPELSDDMTLLLARHTRIS